MCQRAPMESLVVVGGELEWKDGSPSSQDREHPGQPLVSHLQLLGMLTHLRTEGTMEEYPV